MKKLRVGIEEVTHYKIVVEQDGHRYVVAVADSLNKAKKHLKEAEVEYGIRKPRNNLRTP
jgi:hypothetical protein